MRGEFVRAAILLGVRISGGLVVCKSMRYVLDRAKCPDYRGCPHFRGVPKAGFHCRTFWIV